MLCWINKNKLCKFEYQRDQPKLYSDLIINLIINLLNSSKLNLDRDELNKLSEKKIRH